MPIPRKNAAWTSIILKSHSNFAFISKVNLTHPTTNTRDYGESIAHIAKVLGNANLIINNGTTTKNIYGGGNLGMVNGNTNVSATSITVSDSIYGGGNAASVGKDTYLLV